MNGSEKSRKPNNIRYQFGIIIASHVLQLTKFIDLDLDMHMRSHHYPLSRLFYSKWLHILSRMYIPNAIKRFQKIHSRSRWHVRVVVKVLISDLAFLRPAFYLVGGCLIFTRAFHLCGSTYEEGDNKSRKHASILFCISFRRKTQRKCDPMEIDSNFRFVRYDTAVIRLTIPWIYSAILFVSNGYNNPSIK